MIRFFAYLLAIIGLAIIFVTLYTQPARADDQQGAPVIISSGPSIIDPRDDEVPLEHHAPLTMCQFDAGRAVLNRGGSLAEANAAIGHEGRLIRRYKKDSGTDLVRVYSWADKWGREFLIMFNQFGQAFDGEHSIRTPPAACD